MNVSLLFGSLLLASAAALPAAAGTTTYTGIGGYCVHITNCVVYDAAETKALQWSAPDPAKQTPGWTQFSLLGPGGVATQTFYCLDTLYAGQPAPTSEAPATAETDIECSGTDSNGKAFSMTATIFWYGYHVRAGQRYAVTDAVVAITE